MDFERLPLLLALAAIVLPLVLAWVLLAQPSRRTHEEAAERRAGDGREKRRA